MKATGRQCLEAILDHRTPPRLTWATLVDDLSRSPMPAPVRALSPLDFYRHVHADILQFGNYGLPPALQVPSPARRLEPATEVTRALEPDGTQRVTIRSEFGTLTACHRRCHPLKHPIETLEDLLVVRQLWERTRYEEQPDDGSFTRTEAAIGDSGLYLPTLSPSPLQQLLEEDMGLITFYGLLQDYPREVEGLLEVMQTVRLQEWEIVARRTPARALIPVENTSSALLSPKLYRRYSLPQLREVVDVCHAHGKLVIFHMCGHLSHLLPIIRETGLDGANAVTPPPVGDTTVEHALDVCGEDFILLGTGLPGGHFTAPTVTRRQLHEALDALYTSRVRNAKLLLQLGADGLPTPLERFEWVAEWFAQNGE